MIGFVFSLKLNINKIQLITFSFCSRPNLRKIPDLNVTLHDSVLHSLRRDKPLPLGSLQVPTGHNRLQAYRGMLRMWPVWAPQTSVRGRQPTSVPKALKRVLGPTKLSQDPPNPAEAPKRLLSRSLLVAATGRFGALHGFLGSINSVVSVMCLPVSC